MLRSCKCLMAEQFLIGVVKLLSAAKVKRLYVLTNDWY